MIKILPNIAITLAMAMTLQAEATGKVSLTGRPVIISGDGDIETIDRPAGLERNSLTSRGETTTMLFGYAEESASSFGYSKAGTSAVAMEITGEELEKLAGARIKSIQFENGPIGEADIKTYNVFITADLMADPLVQIDAPVKERNWGYNIVKLDEPYVISKDTPIYVGFGITQKSKRGNYPYAFDYKFKPEQHGDFIGWLRDEWEWKNGGEEYGSFCIWVEVEGENLPVNDLAITSASVPEDLVPGQPFQIEIWLKNAATNPVESFAIETVIGNQEPKVTPINLEQAIDYGGTARVTIRRVCDDEGNNIPTRIRITHVNDVEDTNFANSDVTYYSLSLPDDVGFSKNVLIEEFTGQWCGYCPRGYVGMELMRNKYTDGTFVPITVHDNDMIECATYQPFVKKLNAGLPAASVNRSYLTDPDGSYLQAAYDKERARKAFAEIALSGSYSASTGRVDLSAESKFAMSDTTRYLVAFVLTRDSVGPLDQVNYYSGGRYGKMGGFEEMDNPTKVKYNDVAIEISDVFGLPESLPAEISGNTGYTSTHTFTIPEEDRDRIDLFHYAALVINTVTGKVENSAFLAKVETSGISEIATDETDAPIELFTISGIKVDPETAVPGIYIRRQGSKVTKIIVR